MPGLSFQSQGTRRSPGEGLRRFGAWVVPAVLVIVSVALITLCVRAGGGGAFGAVRAGVQTVTKPVESLCSVISGPFKSAGGDASGQVAALEQESAQLKALVVELEEYRQQNQRLAALVQLSDAYALATKSASVISTQSGWDRISTIDKGSNDGLRAGLGVISSCGAYGRIETVTPTTSTVRLITDGASSVSAMVQGSRAQGFLKGSYDGALTLDYISVEYSVGEGDYVITSGDGGVFPKGVILGTVKSVEPDPSKLRYRIHVDPVFNPLLCQEVLVLTGQEGEVGTIVDEDLLKSVQESMQAAKPQDVQTQAQSGDAGGTGDASSADDASAAGDSNGGAAFDGAEGGGSR